MAAQILGDGLYRNIDAVFEGFEVEGRGPGVVQHDRDARAMRRLGNGRNVLHLESHGAGRLREDYFRLGTDQALDAAADQRIVIFHVDTVAREDGIAEVARGLIDAVDHQQVVAGLQEG